MKRDQDLVKLSVSNKVVLYAKKKHGNSSVIIQMTADSKIGYITWKQNEHFSPDANYIVDGAETLNEIVKLSTLGFKIIHLNISWIERFNRLLTQHGKNNSSSFKHFSVWNNKPLAYDIPMYLYDFVAYSDKAFLHFMTSLSMRQKNIHSELRIKAFYVFNNTK